MAGASGYIDGRLVPCLLERGYRVRSLARSPKKLEARGWASEPRIEIVVGDLADTDGLAEQLGGCEAANYLAHPDCPIQTQRPWWNSLLVFSLALPWDCLSRDGQRHPLRRGDTRSGGTARPPRFELNRTKF